MRNTILLFFLALAMHAGTLAQTVTWTVKPGLYDEIVRMRNNLYQVKDNGKIGLVEADGTVLVPADNDNLTAFYDNKALLTRRDGHGMRVTGCLTDDGHFDLFAERYYTIERQEFFSHGLLSVADAEGRLGFIDARGHKVMGFGGEYSQVLPFTEGYAVVGKGSRFFLLNKEGKESPMALVAAGVSVLGCTSVYKDCAYIYGVNAKGKKVSTAYNVAKHEISSRKCPKDMTLDYLACFQKDTGRPVTVPAVELPGYHGVLGLVARCRRRCLGIFP